MLKWQSETNSRNLSWKQILGISPKPKSLNKPNFENYSPEYEKGWTHGCETGLNAYGNSVYKNAYKFYQDPKLINNLDYYRAWKDAYTYCRYHVYNWTSY